MCGLIALVSLEAPVDRALVERGLDALKHRGPDAAGFWRSGDRQAALGHARLSIVAPDNGSQPLLNEDGSIAAVVSGEFYGFRELRSQLIERGHRFRTDSDSEVLVHLYEEQGPDCLTSLRGEFAWVLWDQRRRRLLAARDRFGVRPLLWWRDARRLLIGSEAKALIAMGVEARWDVEALEFATQLQYLPPGRTLFEGVHELRPGHVMSYQAGQVQERPYWDLDLPKERGDFELEEAAALVREGLREAVAVRLDADRPICAQISGGLDSTSVAAIAAGHRGEGFPLYCVGFEDPRYDESPLARESARALGADLRVVRVDQAAILEQLAPAIAHSEGLAINGHIAAKFILSRAIREDGFSVALTGEGADEVFAGYAHFRRDLQPSAELMSSNTASAGLMLPEGESIDLGAIKRSLGFLPTWLAAKGTLGHRIGALTRRPARGAAEALLAAFDVAGQLRGRHPVDQAGYLWSRLALSGYILRTLGDGMEMAHSLEARCPFLDHVLFEAVRELPIDFKIHRGVEKFVLREALRGVVPEAVRCREKHPFLAPPLSLACSSEVQDLLRSRRFDSLPLFDQASVVSVLDRLPAMSEAQRRAWDPALMLAYSAAVLDERYF